MNAITNQALWTGMEADVGIGQAAEGFRPAAPLNGRFFQLDGVCFFCEGGNQEQHADKEEHAPDASIRVVERQRIMQPRKPMLGHFNRHQGIGHIEPRQPQSDKHRCGRAGERRQQRGQDDEAPAGHWMK